jgi:hypothetical protein
MCKHIPLMLVALVALVALSTRAQQTDIPSLIGQLADDAPRTRDLASVHLRQLGRDALPALRDALKNPDPEVASRARTIIRGIEDDLDPRKPAAPPRDPFLPGLDFPRERVILQPPIENHFQAMRRDINVVDRGRVVRITQDLDGIIVTIRETTGDGRALTRITQAKDAASLQRENPDAYALYARYALGGMPIGDDDIRRRAEDALRIAEERRRLLLERQRQFDERAAEARRRALEQFRPRDE